jgi:glycolate oxidase FAD binding subunit
MAVGGRSIVAALRDIVGADAVRDGAEPFDGHVAAVSAAPRTVEQVSRLLAFARDAGLAVLPRGSGSALDLGHPPRRGDLVLDLRGLDRIVDDHPDDLTVGVECGMTLGALARRLAARRQWLPVDPIGWSRRTIGGVAATAASGPLRARYGTMRDLVLGVRFVQADGVVTWGGARVVKSVSGYDVPKLLVGSLGTLGVVCEVTLRLHPMPETERTWIAGFASAGPAQEFVARIVDSTLVPSRVEVLRGPVVRACSASSPPIAVAVAIGSVEAAVAAQGAALATMARTVGADVAPAPDDVWARYDAALAAGPADTVVHVASLAGDLAATMDAIERAGAVPSTSVGGCAALGTFRIVLRDARPEPAARLVHGLREFVGPRGGSVTIRGGPRAVREAIDPWGPVADGALSLMRELKRAFDPTGLLNPGRFVGGL